MSNPVAPSRAAGRVVDARPSLTVMSGFWPGATVAAGRALLAADPSLLLVRHDLSELRAGRVRRIVRTGAGVLEDVRVPLEHGCLSCTLREDVLPTLARLATAYPRHDQILILPEVAEPEAVAAACARSTVSELLRIDSYVTVVDAEHLLDGLAGDVTLAALGLHGTDGDDRALADVVVRQIEYADTVVLWGSCEAGGYDTAQVRALLHRLVPWAAFVHVDSDVVDAGALSLRLRHTRRHRAETPGMLARGLEGYPLGVHHPDPEYDVVSVVFRARRPFQPARLHGILDEVNAGVLRSRGHLWLASQPEIVVAWDFAGGGLGMGGLGRWLDAAPDARWDEVSDQRRVAAALDWDVYYGDRHQHLVFIGIDLHPAALHRKLTGALLTDDELADGQDGWRGYPDPFAGCFGTAAE